MGKIHHLYTPIWWHFVSKTGELLYKTHESKKVQSIRARIIPAMPGDDYWLAEHDDRTLFRLNKKSEARVMPLTVRLERTVKKIILWRCIKNETRKSGNPALQLVVRQHI